MMLSIKNLEKKFDAPGGAVHALGPMSLEVAEGEFVSLLGPSGCGKSTALYVVAGLEQATSGSISLEGKPVVNPGPERGMVFQHYTLFPWLTVRENIRFSLNLSRNLDYADSTGLLNRCFRSDQLLELLGLESFADRHPRELSGGMKQRVAIARALVNRPRLLLMDEPFGALEELQELMILLHRHERTTTLFVTHDIEESIFLSTRIVVFSPRPGTIVADVPVPFSHSERTAELKFDPRFVTLKSQLSRHLRHIRGDGERRQELLARLVAAADRTK
jgi:NitT/TauT family transport system ATP-binding protein